MFERQEQLGLVLQQQFDIRAGEADHHFGIFDLRVRNFARDHLETQPQAGQLQDCIQKCADPRADRLDFVLSIAGHRL